jgi:16S rRNA (guanine1207-N2)-methyltransferase
MPHYSDAPVRKEGIKNISVVARDVRVELISAKGIFSKDRLDTGTKLLLDTCILSPTWHVHDLGCGNGVVGIVVAKAEPGCTVVSSDPSPQAIEITRKNVAKNKLPIITIQSDGYSSIKDTFDTVLLNPPYVAGRQTVFRLFQEAYEHLKPGGCLQVVARHQKGGAMIKQELERIFGNCNDTRRGSGYRVYVSTRDV